MSDYHFDLGDRFFDCPYCTSIIRQSDHDDIVERDEFIKKVKKHLRTSHEQKMKNKYDELSPNVTGNTFEGFLGSLASGRTQVENSPLSDDQ